MLRAVERFAERLVDVERLADGDAVSGCRFRRDFRRLPRVGSQRRNERVGRFRASLRAEQRAPPLAGEGGAEDDHGAMQLPQFIDQPVENGAGVGVVAVHFVENDHLARDAEGADEAVLDVHRGHQRLIDGADREGGEQPALGRVEPRAAGSGLRAEVELSQPGVAVYEQRVSVAGVRFEHLVEEALDPLVDAV